MTDNNKFTTGILILAAGVIILLGKWGVFSFLGKELWPLLLLIPGVLLHLWYFWRKGPSELLVPGGILTIYSIVFFIGNFWGWQTLKYTWPLFLLGISVGLFEFDMFSPHRQNMVLTSSFILGGVSIFFLGWTLFSLSIIYLIAVLLIVAGIWLITVRGKRRKYW